MATKGLGAAVWIGTTGDPDCFALQVGPGGPGGVVTSMGDLGWGGADADHPTSQVGETGWMQLLDRNDRDSHLVWPDAIVEVELTRRLHRARGFATSRGSGGWTGVDRLLEQAFQGSTAVEL